MNESKHHIGEWGHAVAVVGLPDGMIAQVPFVALDAESASKCIRFSLWLLGYPLVRTAAEHGQADA